jgi:hypothetical protein
MLADELDELSVNKARDAAIFPPKVHEKHTVIIGPPEDRSVLFEMVRKQLLKSRVPFGCVDLRFWNPFALRHQADVIDSFWTFILQSLEEVSHRCGDIELARELSVLRASSYLPEAKMLQAVEILCAPKENNQRAVVMINNFHHAAENNIFTRLNITDTEWLEDISRSGGILCCGVPGSLRNCGFNCEIERIFSEVVTL